MSIAYTPIYHLPYPAPGEPIRNTRANLQTMAQNIEAALQAGGVAAPGASDLLAVSGRVSTLEGMVDTEANIKLSTTGHALGAIAHATDTAATGVWDGTRWVFYDTKWQTFTPKLSTTNATNYWTQGAGSAVGRYYRMGRKIIYSGEVQLGGGSVFGGGGTGNVFVDFPPGYYPTYFTSPSTTFAPTIGTCQVYGGTFGMGWAAISGVNGAAGSRRLYFLNATAVAVTGTGTGWNISASGHGAQWTTTYETNFEA